MSRLIVTGLGLPRAPGHRRPLRESRRGGDRLGRALPPAPRQLQDPQCRTLTLVQPQTFQTGR